MTLEQQLIIVFFSAPLAVVAATFGGWLWSLVARSRWWAGLQPVDRAHWAVRFAAIATWVWFAVVEWVL